MIIYDSLKWFGKDRQSIHAIELKIDDEYFGNVIAPVESDIGKKLKRYIEEQGMFLPIEETYDDMIFEMTDEDAQAAIVETVQNLLDSECQSRGYDNGFACASYFNSSDPVFQYEAQKFVAWRDQCWRTCYDLLGAYKSGAIERPTPGSVLNAIPKIQWD